MSEWMMEGALYQTIQVDRGPLRRAAISLVVSRKLLLLDCISPDNMHNIMHNMHTTTRIILEKEYYYYALAYNLYPRVRES